MHVRSDQHFLRRIILALDLAAGAVGYLLALLIRFILRGLMWNVGAYSTFLVLLILICISLNLYRRVRHRQYSLVKMDPVEVLSSLVKDRIVQYVLLVLLLYAVRTIDEISRLVIVLTLVFDLGISAAGRLLLRSLLLKEKESHAAEVHYVILTERSCESIARMRFAQQLPDHADLTGVVFLDEMGGVFSSDYLKPICDDRKTHLFLYLRKEQLQKEILDWCREQEVPVHVFQFVKDQELPGSMTGRQGTYVTIDCEPLRKEGEVFGVRFVPTDVESAVFEVLDRRESLRGEYVCFSNVHTTVTAHNDAAYRDILNGSAFTFADGRPIAKRLRNQGAVKCERVAGPDFMDAIFRSTMDGRSSHYFYGSTPETIRKLGEELPRRYPGIRIAGMVSPPFRSETPEEDARSIAAMNASGADFIWIGLGAPKQERWMAAHRGKVKGILFGVGAGFDFYAGTVKRAPVWVQKIGFEWLYRLFQDPKRLANRYIITNAQFLWYSLRERQGKRKQQ